MLTFGLHIHVHTDLYTHMNINTHIYTQYHTILSKFGISYWATFTAILECMQSAGHTLAMPSSNIIWEKLATHLASLC